MGKYKEIEGDLIALAQEGEFDVITHGCNCFCTMGAGIAPKIAKAFGCDKYSLEKPQYKGDIKKLGQIAYGLHGVKNSKDLIVVNSYTQFYYGKNHTDGQQKPLDYEALTLCLRKINHLFKGKHIGLPQIGCGLAGGIWNLESAPSEFKMQLAFHGFTFVQEIIQTELKDMDVTIVLYKP